jgi:hypothetical protein
MIGVFFLIGILEDVVFETCMIWFHFWHGSARRRSRYDVQVRLVVSSILEDVQS